MKFILKVLESLYFSEIIITEHGNTKGITCKLLTNNKIGNFTVFPCLCIIGVYFEVIGTISM